MTMVGEGTNRANDDAPVAGPDGVDDADGRTPAAPPDSASGGGRAVPFGIAGLLTAAAVLIGLDVGGYRSGAEGEPGPAAIPTLVAVLCAAAAIALVVQTLRSAGGADQSRPALPLRVVAAVAALVAAGFLLEQIGYFVTFTGLAFVAGLLAGPRRWWTSLIVAAVTAWITMIVFGRLFDVPLPAGPIDLFLGG